MKKITVKKNTQLYTIQ